MLVMTSAIPIGRNTPILLLTTVSIMKINPLIEKSTAAFLCDFEFFDSLLFTMKVPLPEVTLSLFHFPLVVNNQNNKRGAEILPLCLLI